VRDAVVIARDEPHGDKRLIAYVTGACGAAELRAWVAAALPEHMVPALVVLEQLPLSPNGKVDRRALPAPDADRAAAVPAVPPRTDLERTIAALWREVLHLEGVGIDDNFFDLGGHSLSLARVASGLRERLEREIPMLLLFQHPTIASLAAALGGGAGAERGGTDAFEDDRLHAGRARRAELRARRRASAGEGGSADAAGEGGGGDASGRDGHAPEPVQRPGRGETIE
jgi:acyl carrier protein